MYQDGPGNREHNIQEVERTGLVLSDEEEAMGVILCNSLKSNKDNKDNAAKLLSVVVDGTTMDAGHKMWLGRFRSNIRKSFMRRVALE